MILINLLIFNYTIFVISFFFFFFFPDSSAGAGSLSSTLEGSEDSSIMALGGDSTAFTGD